MQEKYTKALTERGEPCRRRRDERPSGGDVKSISGPVMGTYALFLKVDSVLYRLKWASSLSEMTRSFNEFTAAKTEIPR